jgi:hypothetical protein
MGPAAGLDSAGCIQLLAPARNLTPVLVTVLKERLWLDAYVNICNVQYSQQMIRQEKTYS